MRRTWTAVGILAVIVLVAGCEAWPSARYDPANTGFNAAETTLGATNVSALQVRYSATVGQVDSNWAAPVVVNGSVFVGAHGKLEVFSDDGSTGCSGSPSTCQPRWTADLAGALVLGSPVVSDNTVFVSTTDGTGSGGVLYAFDASGTTGCSGTPKTCTPLWTAPVGGAPAPTVSNGFVYVLNKSSMAVVDAKGVQGCSGTPKVCSALWTTTPLTPDRNFGGSSAPTVGASSVYLIDYRGRLYAYDSSGVAGCTGVPAVCDPKWTAEGGDSGVDGTLGWTAPVLDGSRVLTYTAPVAGHVELSAFDAGGGQACSGLPVVCSAEWSTAVAGSAENTQLAVAYGSVFVTTRASTNGDVVSAFADDGTGCAGSPMSCPVKWVSVPDTSPATNWFFPIVANGVLYEPTLFGFAAINARGTNCIPQTPPVCTFLAQISESIGSASLSVDNGRVYVLATTSSNSPPMMATLLMYQ